jgi:hypothetical protein
MAGMIRFATHYGVSFNRAELADVLPQQDPVASSRNRPVCIKAGLREATPRFAFPASALIEQVSGRTFRSAPKWQGVGFFALQSPRRVLTLDFAASIALDRRS